MESVYIKNVNDFKILACVDNQYVQFTEKPEKKIANQISNRILKNVSISTTDYKNLVESGVTMALCNLKFGASSRLAINYVSANTLGLDFDNGNSSESILECLKINGISSVFFMNKTFSYTDEYQKYRLTILLDRCVNIDERQLIYKALKYMFEAFGIKADNVQDPTRFFFGTNKKDFICYNPTSTLNTDLFLDTYCNPISIPTNSKNLDTTYKKNDKKRSKDVRQSDIEVGDLELFKNFDFDKAADNCRIFNDFINLKRLTHNELLLIATNLKCINGGSKLFIDTLNKYNSEVKHTSETPEYSNNNYNLIRTCNYYNYKPMSLSYSPYEEDRAYKNLIDCVISNRVEQIEDFETASIEENRKTLNTIFDEVYQNCLNGTAKKVNVIVSSTGTGKTHCIKKVASNNNLLYVMKTHKNIDDFINEVHDEQDIVLASTAKIPTFEAAILNDTIKTLNEVKRFSEVRTLINMVADGYYGIATQNDVTNAKRYINGLIDCSSIDYTLVTTASKFSNITFKHKVAIIDECIASEYIKMGEIYFNDIIKFESKITSNDFVKECINDIIKYVKDIECDKITSFKSMNADIVKEFVKTLYEDDIKITNLLDFIQADFVSTKISEEYGLVINYGYNKQPKNNKMFKIILTSTPDIELLNHVYGKDNVEYFILPETKIVGNLEQYNKHSYSKTSITKLENGLNERVEFIKNTIDDSFYVITYMDCKKLFKDNQCDFHFGFVEGHNDLKGQNIAVVGAMQPNPNGIKIKAALMGVPLHVVNKDACKVRKVEYNGFRFSYNTYSDIIIRNIQLFYIYSQLNQSVGRARLGEYDANVLVFSSLPLKQAKMLQNKIR